MTAPVLARIAAIRPPPKVRIYVLSSPGYVSGIVQWLCEPHKTALEAEGWTVTGESDPPEAAGELPCQECPR